MKKFRRIIIAAPAPVAAVLIFIASNTEHVELPDLGFDAQDKLFHALAYFIFGISLGLFLNSLLPQASVRKLKTWTIVTGAIYAASDEIHQYFVPGRQCDPLDWLADVFGIVLAIMLIRILKDVSNRFLLKQPIL